MSKYHIVRLGELISPANVIKCGTNIYPVLSMTMHDGIVLQSNRFKKSLASLDTSEYKVVKEGQLVVGFPIDEGVLYIQHHSFEGIMSPAYDVYNVDYSRITGVYLESALHSPQSMQYYASKLRGTTARRRSIPKKDLFELPIILPDLATQKHITDIISYANKLIEICKSILEKTDTLVKSRFVEMFGNPITNSHNLPLKTLSELGELGRGISKHRPRNAPELLGGVYPLIQTGDVANASLYILDYNSTYSETGFKQSKMWSKGTLCITIAANIAKTAILTFDSCFPDSVVGFNANVSTNNIFIHFWFSFFQEILEEQAPESAQKNINLKILSELKVIVPPIELQQQFADFVAQTDKSKLAVKQILEKAETLKKSLMQEYFG